MATRTKTKSPKRFFKAMEKLAIVIEQIDLLRDDIRDGTISQVEVQEMLDTISHNIVVVEDDLVKHEIDYIKNSEKK
jgi:tetraacyldisaccharide-1-P 4'-kinase